MCLLKHLLFFVIWLTLCACLYQIDIYINYNITDAIHRREYDRSDEINDTSQDSSKCTCGRNNQPRWPNVSAILVRSLTPWVTNETARLETESVSGRGDVSCSKTSWCAFPVNDVDDGARSDTCACSVAFVDLDNELKKKLQKMRNAQLKWHIRWNQTDVSTDLDWTTEGD